MIMSSSTEAEPSPIRTLIEKPIRDYEIINIQPERKRPIEPYLNKRQSLPDTMLNRPEIIQSMALPPARIEFRPTHHVR